MLSTLLSGIVAVVTLAAILAILGARSPGLTLSAFSVLPLLVVANVWFEHTLKRRSREPKEQDTRLVTVVQQSITTIGLVLAFGRDPDRGSVLFDEHDARDVKIRDLRRHVALVLQGPLLLPTTVAENIA